MIDEEETFKRFNYRSTDLSPQSTKKIVAICDNCRKIREPRKNAYYSLCPDCAAKNKKGQYSGSKNAMWKSEKGICIICGKDFFIQPYILKKGHGKYCSVRCKSIAQSENNRGAKHPNWKGGKIKRKCEICNKEFYIFPYVLEQGHGKYCSQECKYVARRGKYKNVNNPNWKGGKNNKYCSKWNETFREYIRNKYNRKCFICGKTESENGKRLSVHHVNHNKACGCDEDTKCQFVPLCVNCHGKVHGKQYDWEKHIIDKQRCDLRGWFI